jgi:hypothetical protein
MVTAQWNLNDPMASYQEMFAVTRYGQRARKIAARAGRPRWPAAMAHAAGRLVVRD